MPLFDPTRRKVLALGSAGLVGILGAFVLPIPVFAQQTKRPFIKPRYSFNEHTLESLVLFTDAYQAYGPKPLPDPVTVLYPGSGTDTDVLEIGVRLLYETPVKHVRFIFTDIGECDPLDFNKKDQGHQGYKDAVRRIETGLAKNHPRLFTDITRTIDTKQGWRQSNIPHSSVTRWDIAVPTPHGRKKITLYFAYNTVRDREEPTANETENFGSILARAREGYWPQDKKPGKVYPTYFLPSQFDQADILVSKECGDHRLLQFDYTRAFDRTMVVKPRVVLTESSGVHEIMERLRGYRVEQHTLQRESSWGYCLGKAGCDLDMVVFRNEGV